MLGFWALISLILGVSIGVIIVKLLAYLQSSQAIAAMREGSAEDEK